MGPQALVPDVDVGPASWGRWVPPSFLRRRNIPESKDQYIFRHIRSILNKLTDDKFQKLSDDLLSIEITSHIMRVIVSLIYEKAVNEPIYNSLYAKLCKHLDGSSVFNASAPESFRSMLLIKCCDEFESINLNTGMGPSSSNHNTDIQKRKVLGNVRFMAELYKHDLVDEQVIIDRIQQLFESGTQLNLECVCQIFRTCGKELDDDGGDELIDYYFDRLGYLVDNAELPSRIRFMIFDVLELRKNDWVPRNVYLAGLLSY